MRNRDRIIETMMIDAVRQRAIIDDLDRRVILLSKLLQDLREEFEVYKFAERSQ